MSDALLPALAQNFLGQAPGWYKRTIVAFLLLNPIAMWLLGPYLTGWLLVVEFIGYTDLMVDGAPSPHQSDTTLRWLIDRLRS